MSQLKFCAKCGRETLLWDGEKKWSCPVCGYVLFHNVAGAVAVIIKCGDEILFTRRNQDPKKNKLDLPGGFVDPQESAEETCSRELWEEMKFTTEPSGLKYLMSLPNTYEYKGIVYQTLDLFFEYETETKPAITLELTEISEVVWMKPENLQIDDLAFDSQKIFFTKYLAG